MILETLASLGFTNCEIVGEKRGAQTVKIMTDKGWTYDRFSSEADVRSWAVGKRPA